MLLEMLRSGHSSRRNGKTAPAHSGKGYDESAHVRQQQNQITARMLTGIFLSSRCMLVSIHQEYSQLQYPVWGTTPAPKTPASFATRTSRSSSSTSQAGWEKNLGSGHTLDVDQRATLGCGGTCRRTEDFISDSCSVDSTRVRQS